MKRIILYSIALLVAVSCHHDAMYSMLGPENDKPLHSADDDQNAEKSPGSIRIMQYNVGVFHKSGNSSLQMIADMMKELEVDLITLNEVDSVTTRTGNVDQLKAFSSQMGDWNYKYAYAMYHSGGKYGVGAAASPAFTYIRGQNVHLPQAGGGEPRAMAVMEFDKFIIASTHLDLTADARLAQIAVINTFFDDYYAETDKPIFLCGDFNDTPKSDTIIEVLKTWTMISQESHTSPAVNPRSCIDYIFVRKNGADVKVLKSVVYKNFSSGDVTVASDHLPVFVDIILQ